MPANRDSTDRLIDAHKNRAILEVARFFPPGREVPLAEALGVIEGLIWAASALTCDVKGFVRRGDLVADVARAASAAIRNRVAVEKRCN